MRKEQILDKTSAIIKQLVEDLERFEQGEILEGYELSYYMQGLELGLNFADRDEITILLSDICRCTYEPYKLIEQEQKNIAVRTNFESDEIDDELVVRYFKSSTMRLYLTAQSLIKDLGDVEDIESEVDELFDRVFARVESK